MQAPSEDDVARKEALKRRVEEHMLWKMTFFQSRPPPPFIPKCRRRPEPIANAPVHSFYKRALEIVSAEKEHVSSSCSSASPPTMTKTDPPEGDGAKSKQDVWKHKMMLEMERRNPYTDINIRTDPRSTVVVSSLHPKSLEEDIRLFGEQFGRVVSVRLICDHNGKSRRYGFVQFGLEAEARKAVAHSRKRRLHGHAVVMEMERGRLDRDFLPKRLAEAKRQIEGSSSLCSDKRQRMEGSVKCPPAVAAGRSSPIPVSDTRDEVDAFLDDIMNLT
ncbi:putative U1 small nuclear ribonucleoprotein [Trypanosoma cruzi]|uniref:U1 small nuclear ribonucleoprotein, putative n=2 Tax=Trypanosoma cruzi TaxID=5693 RepID=Q4D8I9_TRYCC|nr:U1 small nuclear ribonucleoprotein, putative [Trypanosoma cruzi]EAN88837.1 U1 small nuclear ribonucleoprotein, putative [Trypanosoma cruzi]PWU92427.1 putative U1 small nuclear ribonucleoprotein [Trypanosoma cruzi]RNC39039.1 U1 small nuclear ribonucleoprotein [Trypanosoma cruzi]|eukprot:XP_810688.1 U1 small nuclear ribonucleoprotein [Trypanosoma cruzi strain CL Brener]